MLKKFFIAAALVVASSPAFVSAQDFRFSFDQNASESTTTATTDDATGSLFIFADENLAFRNMDLDFSNSDGGVVAFTNTTVFNAGNKFDSFDALVPEPGVSDPATDGRLFAASFFSAGQVPGSGDADFRAGANGFLLAQVDFDIVGEGTADFSFEIGDLGVTDPNGAQIAASLGTGSITVAPVSNIPEPSSAILLILGAAGMVARRRRS
jgi:hypothetical protein